MKTVYKNDIDFKRMRMFQHESISGNYYFVDYENNKFYKMFEYGMECPDVVEKKLKEIEKLNKSYISNPIDIV